MDNLPPYLGQLAAKLRITRSQVSVSGMKTLAPLLTGGILEVERSGAGEAVVVRDEESFRMWLRKHYPLYDGQATAPVGASRANAVALRKDSKSTGEGVAQGVLHLRALASPDLTIRLDGREIQVGELTARHGIVACLIGAGSVMEVAHARVALIENLECFLLAEALLTGPWLVLNSAGRISDRLIACLGRSRLGEGPLLHCPDYDPVGLSDYLRLRARVGDRVMLYLPDDLEKRFERFGNRKLITEKPKNRALLEQLGTAIWPCPDSKRVFKLIRETGAGLEQEALLLGFDGSACDNNASFSGLKDPVPSLKSPPWHPFT
jgi:hypothetical protein